MTSDGEPVVEGNQKLIQKVIDPELQLNSTFLFLPHVGARLLNLLVFKDSLNCFCHFLQFV